MLKFNNLLRDEGIEPSTVRLVRHQDTRQSNQTVYELWFGDKAKFDFYQRIQGKLVFKDASIIASFVATPFNETLFVGLYSVGKAKTVPKGTPDPLDLTDVGGLNLYDLVPVDALADYRGRLIVEWGRGYRSWIQLAQNQDKPIVEIRRVPNSKFPGIGEFRWRIKNLRTLPMDWRVSLESMKGIYVLVDVNSGKQYVGKADGQNGFWSRWNQYFVSGHGGNVRLKDVPDGDYQVSILETAGSSAGDSEICKMESLWKKKLLTREHGHNAN